MWRPKDFAAGIAFDPLRPVGTSFIEWGAVLAGAVLAAALSFVFLTFGAAIGLSTTSPWADSGVSAKTLATIAIFWAMAQQVGKEKEREAGRIENTTPVLPPRTEAQMLCHAEIAYHGADKGSDGKWTWTVTASKVRQHD